MPAPESIVQEEPPASIAARKADRATKRIGEVIADAPPVAAPERITADELAELRGLQQAVNEGRQRAAQMQEAVTKAVGAFEYVVSRIQQRYGLTARDEIAEDGVIRRETGA